MSKSSSVICDNFLSKQNTFLDKMRNISNADRNNSLIYSMSNVFENFFAHYRLRIFSLILYYLIYRCCCFLQ